MRRYCPSLLDSIFQSLGRTGLIHNVHNVLVLPSKMQTNHYFSLYLDTDEWLMKPSLLKSRNWNEYECSNIALLKIPLVKAINIMLPRFNNQGHCSFSTWAYQERRPNGNVWIKALMASLVTWSIWLILSCSTVFHTLSKVIRVFSQYCQSFWQSIQILPINNPIIRFVWE